MEQNANEIETKELTAEEKNWAIFAHISSFAGYFVGMTFIGPLIIWAIKKEESAFVEQHAKEALNFNLSVLIYAIVSGILIFLCVGMPLLIAVGVIHLVFTIVAVTKSTKGEAYRYPLTIRLIQ